MYSVQLSKKLIFFIIGYILFCGFAIKNLNFNKSCLFLIDVLCLLLLFRNNFHIKKAGLHGAIIILLLLFFTIFLGVIVNDVNVANLMWGIRNQYLALPFFFACTSFLLLQDIQKIFKFLFCFQILNFLCALFQYFVLGYYQDMNNGAFTTGSGQDIFCGILITYYLYQYSNHKCRLLHFLFILFSSLIIAAIEEEKFIFIEVIIVFLYYFLTGKKLNFTKILMACALVLTLSIGLSVLSEINGEGSVEVLTNREAFESYQENAFTLPRIGSSQVISKMFFRDDWQYLFGLGLGKCEESSTLDFIDASFYKTYEWLHYTWFTFHVNFLQTGWLGISLFFAFFIYILVSNFRNKKKCPKEIRYFYDISIVITILCIITIWYNSTLRSYNMIIPFFALSLGGIITRQFVNEK